MDNVDSKKSIISDISRIYSVILLIAVYISSFAFLGFILIAKFDIDFFHITVFFCLSFIVFTKIKNKRIRKIGYYFGKILTIFVSTFILILFLNTYLKISDDINQFFNIFLKTFEIFVNKFALGMLFAIGSILLYFYFASLILKFVLNINLKSKIAKIISVLIFTFIMIFPLPFFYFLNKPSVLTLNDLFYSNFKWFFGFSLISLHLNYLYLEIKRLVSRI